MRSEYPSLFQTEGSQLNRRQGQQYNLFFTLQPVSQVTSLNLDDENVQFVLLLPSLHGLVRFSIAGLSFSGFHNTKLFFKRSCCEGFF